MAEDREYIPKKPDPLKAPVFRRSINMPKPDSKGYIPKHILNEPYPSKQGGLETSVDQLNMPSAEKSGHPEAPISVINRPHAHKSGENKV